MTLVIALEVITLDSHGVGCGMGPLQVAIYGYTIITLDSHGMGPLQAKYSVGFTVRVRPRVRPMLIGMTAHRAQMGGGHA